ncbi:MULTISPECIES: hypothetical protein [unclassified Sphingomonas]|uniref:hypothetical protein n=1 Tax=unclassified Sphingomonas TaxID=196159 RepID=UPI0006F94E13|nr:MULTISPECIES: hypothetical protein [unclassified Sphingomonas]KQM66563.1 hypothetical protein ASE65_00185 [Sphingomonas sp. Leaf16]KQN16718.1 hypothetical protein ASE81_16690 [Sphingomonas sp. Leaf29]KQN23373.1 hypothetical protein ASE83_02445 [Sphingomonas sp. Leaf32]
MTTGAEQGEIVEVGSPVLVPADPVDSVRPWGWMTTIIATATLFLGLFNAHAIAAWFDELPPSPYTEPLRAPIAAWAATTARLGLDTPRAAVRSRWEAAQAARFGDEQPGEDAAR